MPGSQLLEKSEKVGALKTASSHTCSLVRFSASTFSSSRPTRRSPDRQINNDLPRHAPWIIRGNKEGNLKRKKTKKLWSDKLSLCSYNTHKKIRYSDLAVFWGPRVYLFRSFIRIPIIQRRSMHMHVYYHYGNVLLLRRFLHSRLEIENSFDYF